MAMVTVVLLALSGPCQLVAKTGVMAYFHCPFGTLLSTHEVAVIVPLHAEPMLCRADVLASYRLTR
jgi:hypothetical protein